MALLPLTRSFLSFLFIRHYQRGETKEGKTGARKEAKQKVGGTQQIRTKRYYNVLGFLYHRAFGWRPARCRQAGGSHCANTVNNGNEFLFPPLTAFPRVLSHLLDIYSGTDVYSPPCCGVGGRERGEWGGGELEDVKLDFRTRLSQISPWAFVCGEQERTQHSRVCGIPSASGKRYRIFLLVWSLQNA